MVRSAATTVAGYLAELPPDRRATIERLLELATGKLSGSTASVQYGMIAVGRPGGAGLAMASQVQYVAIYGLHPVFDRFAPRLKGADTGRSCLRLRPGHAIDWPLLAEMFAALDGEGPAAAPPAEPRGRAATKASGPAKRSPARRR